VARGLSVRDVEKLAKASEDGGIQRKVRRSETKDADTRALEADLSAALGSPVTINHDEKAGGGKILIEYKNLEGLDDLIRRLNRG
jgi:ParB family chromosome partitioning protein